MAELKNEETSEKKSLNFIEQIVENDLSNGKNGGRVQTRFPPRPSALISALQPLTEAYATCVLTIPTPRRKTWNT